MLRGFPLNTDPNVLVGMDTSDDAGIYRLPDGNALVQTVDFFTPIVDDPYSYGAIAAANALSDVYAMGGKPLTALNILCYPLGAMPAEILRQILMGGYNKVKEAGAVVIGGHSVEDPEPKFGCAVTGIIDPERAITNANARPGDRIVLTKPLGTGIITTAAKFDACPPHALAAAIESMSLLNAQASEVAVKHGVRAGTDVTGFGLAGHLAHIARASGVTIRVHVSALPLHPEVVRLAAEGQVTGGARKNREWLSDILRFDGDLPPWAEEIVLDPQTSGGLALCASAEVAGRLVAEIPGAAEIGLVEAGEPSVVVSG